MLGAVVWAQLHRRRRRRGWQLLGRRRRWDRGVAVDALEALVALTLGEVIAALALALALKAVVRAVHLGAGGAAVANEAQALAVHTITVLTAWVAHTLLTALATEALLTLALQASAHSATRAMPAAVGGKSNVVLAKLCKGACHIGSVATTHTAVRTLPAVVTGAHALRELALTTGHIARAVAAAHVGTNHVTWLHWLAAVGATPANFALADLIHIASTMAAAVGDGAAASITSLTHPTRRTLALAGGAVAGAMTKAIRRIAQFGSTVQSTEACLAEALTVNALAIASAQLFVHNRAVDVGATVLASPLAVTGALQRQLVTTAVPAAPVGALSNGAVGACPLGLAVTGTIVADTHAVAVIQARQLAAPHSNPWLVACAHASGLVAASMVVAHLGAQNAPHAAVRSSELRQALALAQHTLPAVQALIQADGG